MKIFMSPIFSDNPYVPSLGKALKDAGCEVVLRDSVFDSFSSVLEAFDCDVFHLQWIEAYTLGSSKMGTFLRTLRLISLILLLRTARKKVIWTVHNMNDRRSATPVIPSYATRAFVRLVSAIVIHAESGKQQLVHQYGSKAADKTSVIDHAGYAENYGDLFEKIDVRSSIGIPAGAFVFGCLGSMKGYKSPINVIADFVIVQNSHRNAWLVLAGQMEHGALEYAEAAIEDGLAGIVIEDRRISDDEIGWYLSAVDVCVLPQSAEYTSGTVALSHSFACPCIGPETGCIAGQIGDAQLLFDPAKEGSRAVVMGNAIANRDAIAEKGSRLYAQSIRSTWGKMARDTLRIYELTRSW